jgi:hypothetical protein
MKAPAKVDKVATIAGPGFAGTRGTPGESADTALPAAPEAAPERAVASDAAANAAPALATDTKAEPAIVVGKPLRAGPPPTSAALMIQYQRIGRELHKLQELRGTTCVFQLSLQFKAIKIEPSLSTVQSRTLLGATLRDMQQRIERLKGITLHKSCLDNPLAPECQ